MSNYETFYWVVYGDGLNRLRSAAQTFLGIAASVILKTFFDTAASAYMAIPVLWYILALHTRSTKTGYIFGMSVHPGYATFKATIFVSCLILYYCAKCGYIFIEMAYFFEMVLIMSYAFVMLQTGFIGVRIRQKDFDDVFRMKFGTMTEEDLKARERLFKK